MKKRIISIVMILCLVMGMIVCFDNDKTYVKAEITNAIIHSWQNYSDAWESGQEFMANTTFSSTNTNIKANIVSTGWAANFDPGVPDDGFVLDGMWGDLPFQVRSTNTAKVMPGNRYKFKFTIKNGMKSSETNEAMEKNVTVIVKSNIEDDDTIFLMKTVTVPAGVSKQFEFDVPISQNYGSNVVELQLAYGSYLYSYNLTNAVKNGKVSESVAMNNKYAYAYGTNESVNASGTLEFSDIAFQGEKYVETTTCEKDDGSYWKSFSVCTREDGGAWEDALKASSLKKGTDYATEGYVVKGSTDDSFEYYVINSGWDAEYNPIDGTLKDNNPWGMTAYKNDISVENGRDYTISFKVKSTLSRTDDAKNVTSKHIVFRVYNPYEESKDIDIENVNGISGGFIALDSNKSQYGNIGADGDGYVTVVVKIHIPLENYNSDVVAFKFGFGANLVSYPDEIGQKGSIFVKDFKVLPGEKETTEPITTEEETTKTMTTEQTTSETTIQETTQESITETTTRERITEEPTAETTKREITTESKTKKDVVARKQTIGRVKVTGVKVIKRKSIRLTWKKVKTAKVYQIQYATNKKFKKYKVKTTKKITTTLKYLKKNKTYYIRIRAINNEQKGKWSNVKRIKC